jgi:hypothetical protein
MENSTYNGWKNYATWRINLEIFDGHDLASFTDEKHTFEVSQDLKRYVQDYFEQTSIDTKNAGFDTFLMCDYALAFIDDVDWWEIAVHLLADKEEAA